MTEIIKLFSNMELTVEKKFHYKKVKTGNKKLKQPKLGLVVQNMAWWPPQNQLTKELALHLKFLFQIIFKDFDKLDLKKLSRPKFDHFNISADKFWHGLEQQLVAEDQMRFEAQIFKRKKLQASSENELQLIFVKGNFFKF